MPKVATTQSKKVQLIERVVDALPLDVDALSARAEAVLSDELYWFPVRHHSATVARHLDAAIRQRKPKILFMEGPSEANDLVRHIVDAKTKPPVAIYSS